ncbi:TPA: polysaccharide biosynthesis C-terminal domain-containing protein [Vibrio parahaemolyticus]|nr:polysaccharide biosynthesis C-terminal domain-containing protein [Vibrio parahaemolyticus]EIO2934330.1 polysaccharide biosynthesis C-terminal domain-containing protein [Vibrio parahaemolyticus]EJE4224983.1 polysaccharide biosynthesis C-terminal domain-containing protein [Vibrio parahaemolyticus]MDF5525324.1 polysaccharide biosynthesis C-terminal domain-containing protein [Vibrio parahaemolyticus]MDF5552155.1 polysaccharide biosynthesis C-terminal domain-containing protein [Vibrio parahaemoly
MRSKFRFLSLPFFRLLSDNIFSFLVNVIITILISNQVGLGALAQLTLLQTISILLSFVSNLGTNYIFIREYKNDGFCPRYLTSYIFLNLLTLIFYILSFSSIVGVFSTLESIDFYYIFIFIISRGIFNFCQVSSLHYQAQGKAHLFSNFSILSKFTQLMSFFIIGYFYGLNVNNIYIPFLIESVVLFVSFRGIKFSIPKKKFLRSNRIKMLTLVRLSCPLILSSIMVQINIRADILLIEFLGTEHDLEVYSAVARLILPAFFFPRIIGVISYPFLLEYYRESKVKYHEFLEEVLSLCSVISILFILLSISFGYLFFDKLFFEKGYDMYILFSLLSLSWLFIMKGPILGRALIVAGCEKHEAYKTSLGALINIFLNFLLISNFGSLGAVVASIVSYSISDYFYYSIPKDTKNMFFITSRTFIPKWSLAKSGFDKIVRKNHE